jgi:CheY-like chemotaxis protein
LREILEGGGHEVIATFDADEAIEVLERVGDIQLVITDINMPGSMDGLRLAAAIRDRWSPIRLIVVTGCAPPNRSELPRYSLFIPKPYWGGRNPFSGVLLPKVDQAIVTAAAGCVHCLQP